MVEILKLSMNVTNKLSLINKRIDEVITTNVPDLKKLSHYTLDAGGKRLRPLIVLLVYEINSDKQIDNIIDLAVAYELMHTASLIHDDIIDEAEERRGMPALYKKFNLGDAIVTGDYLFSIAYRLGAKYGNEVSDVVAMAAERLAEGQIIESRNLGNLKITEDTYIDIISRKTAYFFGAGAASAAMVATDNQKVIESMRNFAFNVGMAFQITDDILDITGKEEIMGKNTFTDLKHSVITLPIIKSLQLSDSPEKENLINVIMGKVTDPDSIRMAKRYMIENGSIDYSLKKASHYIEKAIEEMKNAKKSPDLETLIELAWSVIARIK